MSQADDELKIVSNGQGGNKPFSPWHLHCCPCTNIVFLSLYLSLYLPFLQIANHFKTSFLATMDRSTPNPDLFESNGRSSVCSMIYDRSAHIHQPTGVPFLLGHRRHGGQFAMKQQLVQSPGRLFGWNLSSSIASSRSWPWIVNLEIERKFVHCSIGKTFVYDDTSS